MRHGAPESIWGVRIGDMQPLRKRIKTDCALALELYASGNSDAMYLAGLIADPPQMRKKTLEDWVKQAPWHMISDCTVAGVAAESPHGWSLGTKWIKSRTELTASAGWSTLAFLVTLRPDAELDLAELEALLVALPDQIHSVPNQVRYAMNGFVIAVGCCVTSLTTTAETVAQQIGRVHVDMGETACKVPDALEMIAKVRSMNRLGKKRDTVRC